MIKRKTRVYLPMLAVLIVGVISACTSINNSGASLSNIRLQAEQSQGKWPIIYSSDYNISFAGLERFHPFDTKKYGRVFKRLKTKGLLKLDNYYIPLKPDDSVFLRHHSQQYLDGLETSKAIAKYTEVGLIKSLPNTLAYNAVVAPAKMAASGSILAGELALDYGWAINLGGGYHHASKDRAGGFCAIADVSLSILHLMDKNPEVKKVMIIDLDAHQGNGHGRDFTGRDDIFIVDVYNAQIYPGDETAKTGIDLNVELQPFTKDAEYLSKLDMILNEALKSFSPDIIYYVAGMDVLEGDQLGQLSISRNGILQRDQMVFDYAFSNETPVVMLFGGGYQKSNANIIADSIENLMMQFSLKPQKG